MGINTAVISAFLVTNFAAHVGIGMIPPEFGLFASGLDQAQFWTSAALFFHYCKYNLALDKIIQLKN